MKYKVGDIVKIKSWISMEAEFGLGQYGNIKTHSVFTERMKRWCSKIVTIKEVHLDYYNIKEDVYSWSDDVIDHRATKAMSIVYRLEILKELIISNVKDDENTKKIKKYITKDIKILKSKEPRFYFTDVEYYNNLFRKIKGRSK